MLRYLLLILVTWFGSGLRAQENTDVLFANGRAIETDRYEGVKGIPFVFAEDRSADLHLTSGGVYRDVAINYNSFSGNWEAKKGNQFIEILEADFLKIEIFQDGDTLLFLRNIHPRFDRRFIQVLYRGREVLLVKDFETTIATVTIQDVGQTRETKRFNNKESLVLIRRGQDSNVSGNTGKVVQALGGDKALNKFIKAEKLKLRNEADLLRLLAYYEANFVD